MKLAEVVKFIDWLIYFFLFSIAIYSIIESNVIQDYFNKNSDTYQTEIQAQDVIIPDFTFCDWTYQILDLINQFEVDYILQDTITKEQFEVKNFTKTFLYSGQCLLISLPQEINVAFHIAHHIRLKFNSSGNNTLPELNAKVSSRNNLLLGKVDQDGNAMVSDAKPKQRTIFRM